MASRTTRAGDKGSRKGAKPAAGIPPPAADVPPVIPVIKSPCLRRAVSPPRTLHLPVGLPTP